MARRGTGNITLRLDRKLWDAFGGLVEDRSAVLRDFVRWYVHEPGVRMPRRPGTSVRERPGGTP